MSSQFIFAITTPVGNEAAGANEYSLVAFFYSIQAAVLLLLPHLLSSVWWWTENNYNFGSVLILRPEFICRHRHDFHSSEYQLVTHYITRLKTVLVLRCNKKTGTTKKIFGEKFNQ